MRQELESAPTISAGAFADRVAEEVERKRSQLLVGLDPRAELLPVELRAGAHVGRAEAADACARFCTGLVDAVCPYVVGVKVQLAFFEVLGADGARAFESRLRLRPYGRPRRDRGRKARRHRLDGAGVRGCISRGTRGRFPTAGRCADGEPVPRERLRRAADCSVPALRQRHLLPRAHVELRQRRRPRPCDLRRAAGSGNTSPSSSISGARSSSGRGVSRASARWSAPPIPER